MKPLPQSPDDLKAALLAIFPLLPRDFGAWGESVLVDAGPTCESLLREFSEFLARNIDQLPDRTLRRFAELVARSRAQAGPVGRAFEQVLLPQVESGGPLVPLGEFVHEPMRRI